MTTTHEEFINTHAVNGVLSPEHAAELLELGQGDTSTTLETNDEPDVVAATAQNPGAQVANEDKSNVATTTAAEEPNAANAVILARDGKHLISYSKLEEARAGAQHWKGQAEANAAELETLRAQAQQRADAGLAPTKTDNAVAAAAAAIDQGTADLADFGDFSEEALAKGIQKMVDQRVQAQVSAAMLAIDEKLKPFQAKQAVDASEAHYTAIYAKHPDADSLAESKELADWIATQPSFARAGYETALTNGTTADVIELFDSFKKATGATQAQADTTTKVDVKAAAKQAIANAPAHVPTSLSDIPGGRGVAGTRDEAMTQMGGRDLLGAMENMTPQQIEAYLNRSV